MAKAPSLAGLVRFNIGVLFVMAAALSWDIWWQGAFGRDSFIEPPHLLLYAAGTAAIAASAIGWQRFRDKSWRRVLIALLFVPLAAAADEIWRRLFGAGNLSSAFIVWSPSHLLIAAGISGAIWFLFPKLENDRLGRQFLASLIIAAAAGLLLVAVAPFHPLGMYRIWGPWGASLLTAVIAGILIASQSLVGGFGRATTVGVFLALVHVIQYHWGSAGGVSVPFHAHPPVWLVIASVLAAAVLIDILRKLPEDALGGAAGLIFGAVLFGFISLFDPEFVLAGSDVIAAVSASAGGGVIGGFLARQFAPR